jgi:hypothetical protein
MRFLAPFFTCAVSEQVPCVLAQSPEEGRRTAVGYDLAEKGKRVREKLKVILLSGRESDSHGRQMIRKPFCRMSFSEL